MRTMLLLGTACEQVCMSTSTAQLGRPLSLGWKGTSRLTVRDMALYYSLSLCLHKSQ